MERRYEGLWWIPEKEGDRIAGTLNISEEGRIFLDLIGSFKDIADLAVTRNFPVILGVANSKLITLTDCIETGSSFSFPGFTKQKFDVQVVYIGAHFDSEANINFDKVEVDFPYLAQWTSISGVKFDYIHNGKFSVVCELPQPIEICLPMGKMKISFSVRNEAERFDFTTITERTTCIFVSDQVQSLDELFRGFINPLQNFMTLATMVPNYPTRIALSNSKILDQGKRPISVEAIFYILAKEPLVKKLGHDRMLFKYGNVRESFQNILYNWFMVGPELENVFNLFFSTYYNPGLYLEQRFMNSVQTVEAYHRRRKVNYQIPEEEHNKRIIEITKAVPEKYQDWLEGLLMYSNEPRLKQRLSELISGSLVEKDVLTRTNKFIRKVLDTRNYYTHYDKSLEKRASQGEELYYVTKVLDYLLMECFLKELGLKQEEIKELFQNNQHYLFDSGRAKHFV
jgi:hypothetical protein